MSSGFSLLEIRRFRRLKDVRLELGPFNVLIGANGVGKSSILEVMQLLAISAGGTLETAISRAGGVSALISQGDLINDMEFVLETVQGRYNLMLSRRGNGYAISDECLLWRQDDRQKRYKIFNIENSQLKYFDGSDIIIPTWAYKMQETGLAQGPKTLGVLEGFRQLLAATTEIYHGLDISARSPVRTPQSLQPADTPGSNGETLLSCLYMLRENEPGRYDAVLDTLRAAFPSFVKLDLPVVAAGAVTLRWLDKDFGDLYPHQLSEGTLRLLWLITLLQSPGLPKVTLIDEPEVSLHPEMLHLLVDLMREASSRTQLIVATHSDRFVRFLQPEELVVCDLDENGGTLLQRADRVDLDKWLADYTLDELWSMGRLGGRS